MPPPTVTPTPTSTSQDVLSWGPPLDIVRGQSYYLDAIVSAAGGWEGNVTKVAPADLVREPTNEHDPNAIRVEVEGQLVGHIAATAAADLAPRLDGAGCARMTVTALIKSEGSKESGFIQFGVYLWLDRPLSPGPSLVLPPELQRAIESRNAPREHLGPISGLLHAERYFEIEGRIGELYKERDFATVADLSREMATFIAEFVPQVVERRGSFYSTPNAVTQGCYCLALAGDTASLTRWREIAEGHDAMREWISPIEQAIEEEAVAEALLEHLRAQGPVIQSEFPKIAGANGRRVQHACWMLEQCGLIRREKISKGYLLSLAELEN